MIGRTISHYRIVEKLGEGGMGVVYLAEDTVLGRRVAIKTLTSARGPVNQHFRMRFLREAQAISKLSHPHIANIYDYGEMESGEPFIVMELVEGKTLADLIRSETLTIPRALEIIKQVAEALEEAHGRGIVHRDIKPSNIAINERGNVKVLDFGLAKHVTSTNPEADNPDGQALDQTRTREGVIVGTPMYLSPEQALGVPVDARSDLFSLGAVLYECIAGRPAFPGKSDIDICAKVIRDDPPPPSEVKQNIPKEVEQLTLKALAKKPEDRWQSADAFRASLLAAERALDQPVSNGVATASKNAVPPLMHAPRTQVSTTASATLSGRRVPIGYVLLTALVVTLVALVSWYFTNSRVYRPSPAAQKWFELGEAAMREGAYFKAIKPLQEAVKSDPRFALARARLAEAWTELDFSDKAKDEFLQIDFSANEIASLSSMDQIRLTAIQNTIKRDYTAAVKHYQTLVSIVPAEQKAYAYLDLGRAYARNHETAKALESYAEATRRNPNYGAAFLYLGLTNGRKRQYAEAYVAFDQAQRLFDIATDQDGIVEVLLQRGVLLAQQGKVNEARLQLMQALQRAAALENKDKQIKALLNLSHASILAGGSDQAHQYSTQALELAKANGLENLTTGSLIDIGNTYFSKGDYAEAEKHFKEALKWAELYKGGRNRARALLSLASLSAQQDDPDRALDFASRALPFYEEGGFAAETSQAYSIKGRALNQTGEFETAQTVFGQQLELAKKANDPLQVALAHENLGLVLSDMQRYPEALAHFSEQQRIAESLANELSASYAKMNTANMLWQLGYYEAARSSFGSVFQIANSQKPRNKDLLAWTSLFRAQMALSEADFSEAIAGSKHALTYAGSGLKPVSVRATYVLGLAESSMGRPHQGRKSCEHAVQLAREMRDPRPLSDALLALSQAALTAGDVRAALATAIECGQRFAAATQQESEWHALVIQAQARFALRDQQEPAPTQLVSQVRMLLAELKKNWGDANYSSYCRRPDVRRYLIEVQRMGGPV